MGRAASRVGDVPVRSAATTGRGRNRLGIDIRDVITALDPILRGWGNYFRTGNAADKFQQIDSYVVWRLRRPGQTDLWTEEWFNGHGFHRLRGTIRHPRLP
jgi:RNA-directed DNA polymerase